VSSQRLKQKLASGGRAWGTFFQLTTNPAVVDVLPASGLDFVVCTAEHNALELADFLPVCYSLRAKGIACLARIHSRDTEDVAKVCDVFDGVVVPYVEDLDQARRLAAAAKYRPLKGEALERVLATGEWPSAATEAYCRDRCKDTFFAAMIESARSVANLDAICSIDGIDAVFVGPNDMTVSLGIPEERDHPKFIETMQTIIDTAERHNIPAGCHFTKWEHTSRLLEQGARFIPYGSDMLSIQLGVAGFLAAGGTAAKNMEEKII
jgi:2-keto-3-deoxy-L-rhamnonate aldolase RhmA